MKYVFKYGSLHTDKHLTPEQIKEEEHTKGKLLGVTTKGGLAATYTPRPRRKRDEFGNLV